MAYVPMTPQLGVPKIADAVLTASTTAPKAWKHGDIIRAVDPTYGVGEFIYLKGVADTVVGSAATYNLDDWTTTLTVADAIGPIAIAMAATVANYSGWYQISGKAVVKAGTVSDDGNVYLTSTPGQLDDAVVDGDMVHLAKFASANGTPSAGLAEIEISRPYSDNIATND